MPEKFDYDIAFSFAGEDRHHVEPIVEKLKQHGVNVFYDREKEAAMWGRDLAEYLGDVYLKQSHFCVMFISSAYAEKMWTRHERRNALARALKQKTEYILPVRVDSTELDGFPPTVHYIDVERYGTDDIVHLILAKLDENGSIRPPSAQPRARFNIPIPKLKKDFTEREKHVFARDAFKTVADYFEQALTQLQESDRDIETDFESVHRHKFLGRIYVKGELAKACKVWLGGSGHGSDDQICYAEGRGVERDNDSSYNDTFSVASDGHQLGFEGGFSGRFSTGRDDLPMTAEQAAASLWERFIEHLKH